MTPLTTIQSWTRPQLESAFTQREVQLGEFANEIKLWIERRLLVLEHRDTSTTSSTGFVNTNGFAFSAVPDWELRQKLSLANEILGICEQDSQP